MKRWSLNLSVGFASLMVVLFSNTARADLAIDLGATFSSDSLSTGTTSTGSQTFYNLGGLFNLDSKMHYNLGWMVFGISQSTSGTTTSSYSSFDMGPAFRWNIDKSGIYSATFVYGYLAKGKYNNGTTSEDWEGSSLWLQLAAEAPLREDRFYMGVSLNYYAGTYTEKTVNSVKSPVTAQKSSVFPMISVSWRL